MPIPVTGSMMDVHFVDLPPPPPPPPLPPLPVKGAGAVGLIWMTVLLMSPPPSPPPLASAGAADMARLSAVMPAVMVVRLRFIRAPPGRGLTRGGASTAERPACHWTLVLGSLAG